MQSLFSIENYGETMDYINSNGSMYELLIAGFADFPYAKLTQYGKRISSMTAAEIEQSNNFAYSIRFNFDDNTVEIYRVYGNISEEERTDDNCAIIHFNINNLKLILKSVPDKCVEDDSVLFDFLRKEYELKIKKLAQRAYDKYVEYCEKDAEVTLQYFEEHPEVTDIFKNEE